MTSPTPEQRAQQIWREEAENTPCVGGVWNPNVSIQRAMVRMWAEGIEAAARVAGAYPPEDSGHSNMAVAFNAAGNIAHAIRALSSSAQGEGA